MNRLSRLVVLAGVVSTIAGTGKEGMSDGPALQAQLCRPSGLAIDASGGVVFADHLNDRIRRLHNGES